MAVPLEQFVKQLEDSGILAGETLKDFLPAKSEPKDVALTSDQPVLFRPDIRYRLNPPAAWY
jgi:hypothetical protein